MRELGELFSELPVRLQAAEDLGLPEPEETGATFEANAELKAVVRRACRRPPRARR